MVDIGLLKRSNLKLGLTNEIKTNRDKNIIFVYCPPKVGSTSLVSSIRISCSNSITILHVHAENMLETLCGIKNVSIKDIIHYNRSLGKNITVIDIYRTPIEHKISDFFENIIYHFNNTEKNINNYEVNKLIQRFNRLFPHLTNTDYFKKVYNINNIPPFNHSKKYIMVEQNGIKYIKLRLQDSTTKWSSILNETLGLSVHIVKYHLTEKKDISVIFKKFKHLYRVPENLLELIKTSESFQYYLTLEEQQNYINEWNKKLTSSVIPFTNEEYSLYKSLSTENHIDNLAPKVQARHYIDEGCCCNRCVFLRNRLLNKLQNGLQNITEKDKVLHIPYLYHLEKPKRIIHANVHTKLRNNMSKYSFSTKNINTSMRLTI